MTIEEAEAKIAELEKAREEDAQKFKDLSEKYDVVSKLNAEIYKQRADKQATATKSEQQKLQEEAEKHRKECEDKLKNYIRR